MKRLFRKKNSISSNSPPATELDARSQLPPSPPSGYNSTASFTDTRSKDPSNLLNLHPGPPPPSPPLGFEFIPSRSENDKDDPEATMLAGFTAQSKKKPGFLARFQSKNLIKQSHHPTITNQTPSEIEGCITWFCASDQNTQDWAHILEFCDRLSTSEVGCKEAAHALRKELKHATPPVQVRAVRLTVILVLNSSDRLRLQIASKKFLETVEEVFNKAGKDLKHGQDVREMIWKAFSVLGYEFQRDGDLQAFTSLYNKIKPTDSPMGGAPLEDSDTTFAPSSIRQSRNRPLMMSNHSAADQVPLPEMRDLKAEAEVAKANARLLIEALAYTTPAEMESNELIQEFHSKCLQNQNQLLDDIPWATAQAEQSRLYASNLASHQQPLPQTNPFATPNPPLSQSNPFAPLVNGKAQVTQTGVVSKEEQLLASLLSANSDLVDAFRQYDEMDRLARSEAEVRLAEARSKVETRIGNNVLVTDMGGSSGSGAPSQGQRDLKKLSFGSRNPFGEEIKRVEGYVVEEVTEEKPIEEDEKILGSAEPFSSSSDQRIDWLNNQPSDKLNVVEEPDTFESSTTPAPIRLNSRVSQKTDESMIIDRFEPSEKALGKMRRISDFLPPSHNNSNSNGNNSNGGLNLNDQLEQQAELERRREEVETKFRERYKLFHQQQQGKQNNNNDDHGDHTLSQ